MKNSKKCLSKIYRRADIKDLPEIFRPLTKKEKRDIDKTVPRIVKEYGEMLRLLGKDD